MPPSQMRELLRSHLGPLLAIFGSAASTAPRGGRARRATPSRAGLAERPTDDGESAEGDAAPGAVCRVGNLDDRSSRPNGVRARDIAIVRRIELRVRNGELEVPQLSSTAMTLLDILNRPSAEMSEIADVFATDPFLSAQLLSTANSVIGGSRVGQTSIKACVVRVGMRSLRGMILAASMRSHLFNGRVANDYAEMAWRQALSVAAIARAIATHVGEDGETAFTLGLLHDIGKLPLLSMLAEEAGEHSIDQALVGLLFLRLHEKAGAVVAETWRLGDDLTAVCGRHHDFEDNLEHAREAAFASLVHKLDLYLSLRDEVGFRALKRGAEMECLKVPDLTREVVLRAAREAFVATTENPQATAVRAA